ncbi:hypothetical protein K525DRAFT_206121 [Schizophyllum commune Loenen D]|nr:hypothetical protein K525DRAFT_206121 [Schizophyllum commune Loenen D]
MHDLTSIDVSVASIDKEITIIMDRVANLRRVRTKLVEDRRTKRSLLSPLRRLPTEILELIIRASLPDKWLTHGSGRAFLPLAQTCHRLRAITLAMSDLWCNIGFPSKYRSKENFLAYANCLLARARERPIDLTMPRLQDSSTQHPDTLIDQWVTTHVSRFRSIDWCPSRAPNASEMRSSLLNAPLLESLRIMGNEDFSSRSTIGRFPTLEIGFDAPNLRRLSLRLCSHISRVAICRSRLQDLEIGTPILLEPDMRVLQTCTSLKTLKLALFCRSASQKMEAAALQLRFDDLRSLTVADHGHAVCRYLRAPNLVNLALETGDHAKARPSVHASFILDMLRGPSPPVLKSLVINTDNYYNAAASKAPEYAAYLSIFACNPALSHLELVYRNHYPACNLTPVLQGLILQPNAPPLLPSLDHLALRLGECESFGDHEAALLREIFLSRWEAARERSVRPITRLTLHGGALICGAGVCRCATKGEWQKQLEAWGTAVDRTPCGNLP